MVNIAVLGYGTVGSGVVEVINTNHEIINKRAGEEINIKYVLDLRDFPGDPVQQILTHDFNDILNDDEVKVVVEVMGGINPAYTFVKQCLAAGKSVATSNKELVASHGPELLAIAKENNVNFLFEASVHRIWLWDRTGKDLRSHIVQILVRHHLLQNMRQAQTCLSAKVCMGSRTNMKKQSPTGI